MDWHILVVDDDLERQRALADGLGREGFEVAAVVNKQAALDKVEREGLPHLAVLDATLPGSDGLKLARDFLGRGVPVILTGEDDLSVVLEGLQWADDFIRRPYDIHEMSARVKRVLSRISDFGYARSPVLEITDRLSVDYANNRLIIEGQAVSLTPIESQLLHVLLNHKGHVVDSQTLLLRVWPSGDVYEDTLRVHIHRLRSKLEVDPRHPKYIVTERNSGYLFNPDPS